MTDDDAATTFTNLPTAPVGAMADHQPIVTGTCRTTAATCATAPASPATPEPDDLCEMCGHPGTKTKPSRWTVRPHLPRCWRQLGGPPGRLHPRPSSAAQAPDRRIPPRSARLRRKSAITGHHCGLQANCTAVTE